MTIIAEPRTRAGALVAAERSEAEIFTAAARSTTHFQKKVYTLCSQIPSGKVSTYKILAEKLQSKAYRAVGQALNKNPFAPRVPCHRVVASNGTLGGFAQGTKAKKELLEKEGIQIEKNIILNFEKVLYWF